MDEGGFNSSYVIFFEKKIKTWKKEEYVKKGWSNFQSVLLETMEIRNIWTPNSAFR